MQLEISKKAKSSAQRMSGKSISGTRKFHPLFVAKDLLYSITKYKTFHNFFSLFDKHDDRRRKLEERYGFSCTCSLCEMEITERSQIENSRLKYKELENQIKSCLSPSDMLPLMKEKYQMMAKGQIMFPRFIRMHAFDCIQIALILGNLDEAHKYVEKGYQAILIEEGKKGPRTQEYAKCVSKKITAERLVQNILALP